MAPSFGEGYRAISFAYVKYERSEERGQFASNAFSYLSKLDIDPYIGVCFGKYSRVLDFYHRSAKIASFHLAKIQEKMDKDRIKCAFSTILCKPFEINYSVNNAKFAVSVYAFLKPDDQFDYSQVLSICGKVCKKNSNIRVEPLWNNSLYPLIVVAKGNNYRDTIESIMLIRAQSKTAIDTSSYVTLRIDPESYKPIDDEIGERVSAIIFQKLSSLSEIDKTQTRLAIGQPVSCSPYTSLGWYDICDHISFKNLSEVYDYGQRLKKESKGKISFTSTLLLGGTIP